MLKRFAMTLAALLLFTAAVSAQNKQVTGTVKDVSGTPLPGVSVLVDGTLTGAITDLDGKYSLSAKSSDALVFSFFGMKTQRIAIAD
ncbi:MAG: carboxypeptidase-like regulatory domain-containing protein [Bacteroidia bacterium]|nr:carboxypeptidase-like regulatory domain-containing protein [Bacteroidia bacterium]